MVTIKDTGSVPREGWSYPGIAGPPLRATNYQQLYGVVVRHYRGNGQEPPTREAVDLWVCQNLTVSCVDGQHIFRNKLTDPPTYASRGMKGPDWPLLLRPMKLMATPEDRGLGDIVARIIGPVGGSAYKAWYRTIFGKSCGCSERQDRLNEEYPL